METNITRKDCEEVIDVVCKEIKQHEIGVIVGRAIIKGVREYIEVQSLE